MFSQGKRAQGSLCRIMALPGEGRVGFATPKSLGPIARRNRLKRRFREAVRLVEDALDPRFDYVVAIHAGAAEAEFEAILRDLASTFRKMTERWGSESACS